MRARRRVGSWMLPVALLACAGVFFVLGGWIRRAGRAPASGRPSSVVASTASALVPPASAGKEARPEAPPAPLAARAPDPDLGTARAFLADYYGERWPEFERAIQAAGVDLDTPYVFTPWEDVELEFARVLPLEKEEERRGAAQPIVDWPEVLTAEWVGGSYGVDPDSLDDADLVAVSDLASGHNQQLRDVAQEWVHGIDMHLRERWETGQYFKAPFTTMGLYAEQGFFSTSTAGYGWGVSVVLKREEYPDMVEIEQRAAALRELRDGEIEHYLAEARRAR